MSRHVKIEKLSKEIQIKIDKLNKINCSIDSGLGGVGVFDNTIDDIPEEQCVFTFNNYQLKNQS